MDAVCQAIIDVATSKEAPPAVVNLAHPRPIAWHAMMGDASKALVSKGVTDKPLPLVPFALWASTLEDGVSEKLVSNRFYSLYVVHAYHLAARHSSTTVLPRSRSGRSSSRLSR